MCCIKLVNDRDICRVQGQSLPGPEARHNSTCIRLIMSNETEILSHEPVVCGRHFTKARSLSSSTTISYGCTYMRTHVCWNWPTVVQRLCNMRILNCTVYIGRVSQKGGTPTSPPSAHHYWAFLVVSIISVNIKSKYHSMIRMPLGVR